MARRLQVRTTMAKLGSGKEEVACSRGIDGRACEWRAVSDKSLSKESSWLPGGPHVRVRPAGVRGEMVVVAVEGSDFGISFPAAVVDDRGVREPAALPLQFVADQASGLA